MQPLIEAVHEEFVPYLGEGKVADYIPELAKVDPHRLAIAVATADGRVYSTGDDAEAFTIQSISKVFALTLALGKVGDDLWRRVGREPSGTPFDSIIQLEHEQGIPRNPFINAGALVVTDILLSGYQPRETIGQLLEFVRYVANDETIAVDPVVARSETEHGYRNRALANFMLGFGNIEHAVDLVLGVYFHQCAIAMDCRQLAKAGLFLATGGKLAHRNTGVVSTLRARRINALMLTCGQYDGSGDFAFRVGLPSKSGVSGGLLAIVPNVGSVAVWSPALNKQGNSLIGTLALERLAERAGWSIF
ncbi:glutaminase [Methyloligella solikamskensis]|uniref:Glutaminase n=1 Tax=Methyloligella solikamskensis TaxID=1177756 RepID=A0ABW3J777_9HYPH